MMRGRQEGLLCWPACLPRLRNTEQPPDLIEKADLSSAGCPPTANSCTRLARRCRRLHAAADRERPLAALSQKICSTSRLPFSSAALPRHQTTQVNSRTHSTRWSGRLLCKQHTVGPDMSHGLFATRTAASPSHAENSGLDGTASSPLFRQSISTGSGGASPPPIFRLRPPLRLQTAAACGKTSPHWRNSCMLYTQDICDKNNKSE
jgi:hypothetical protein